MVTNASFTDGLNVYFGHFPSTIRTAFANIKSQNEHKYFSNTVAIESDIAIHFETNSEVCTFAPC